MFAETLLEKSAYRFQFFLAWLTVAFFSDRIYLNAARISGRLWVHLLGDGHRKIENATVVRMKGNANAEFVSRTFFNFQMTKMEIPRSSLVSERAVKFSALRDTIGNATLSPFQQNFISFCSHLFRQTRMHGYFHLNYLFVQKKSCHHFSVYFNHEIIISASANSAITRDSTNFLNS